MDNSYCEKNHRVWWGLLNGKRVAFVQVHIFRFLGECDGGTPVARAMGTCYRLHSAVCPSNSFMGRPSKREGDTRRNPRPRKVRPTHARGTSRPCIKSKDVTGGSARALIIGGRGCPEGRLERERASHAALTRPRRCYCPARDYLNQNHADCGGALPVPRVTAPQVHA